MKSLIDPLKYALAEPRNDGKLHFSQHLQHDRHAALYMAHGYPHKPLAWANLFPMLQGTGIHERIHEVMPRVVDKYLPEHPVVADDSFKYSWTGSVDAFVEAGGTNWILDYKTISGAGMGFLGDEPKLDHRMQVSAYHVFNPNKVVPWRTAIIYFPSSPDYKRKWSEPVFMEFEPFSEEIIRNKMRKVEAAIDDYKASGTLPLGPKGEFVWRKKYSFYVCKFLPHYTARFCPWGGLEDDPCGCSKVEPHVVAQFRNDELTFEDGYDKFSEEIGLPEELEKG